MNLSKIYRGTETDGMQQFQFRSFGDPEPAPSQAAPFDQSAPPIVPPAPVASGPSAQDLEEAYAKGRREGLNEADERLTTATQGLVTALEEVSRLREALASNGSQDMLRMVMAVSEQIIRREVAADPAVVQGIIENALQSSVRADQYRVHVNPADLDKVTEKKPLFLASISGLKNLSIEGDPSISPGGCRVESELGEVDATLETQLEAIQQALTEAIMDV